jgi:NEDD8-activating enzyme E1 regulatory subunit
LIVLRQYGLIGSLRVYSKEVCAIESKPDMVVITDLRLVNPFPELKDFALSVNLAELDKAEHKHCPFAIILI